MPGHSILPGAPEGDGPVLPSGDAVHFLENYDYEGVPGFNFDRAQTIASIQRIKQMQKNLERHASSSTTCATSASRRLAAALSLPAAGTRARPFNFRFHPARHRHLRPHAGGRAVPHLYPGSGARAADRLASPVHRTHEAGAADRDAAFSIQSVSKPADDGLVQAVGEMWKRCLPRFAGQPACLLAVKLESEHGKPRNRLINAGVIVVADVPSVWLQQQRRPGGDAVRTQYGETADIDEEVAVCRSGDRLSRVTALANPAKSFRRDRQ